MAANCWEGTVNIERYKNMVWRVSHELWCEYLLMPYEEDNSKDRLAALQAHMAADEEYRAIAGVP